MNRRAPFLFCLGLLLAGGAGCAPVRPATDLKPLRNELAQLRQDQLQQATELEQQRSRLQSLDNTLREQQSQIEKLRQDLAAKPAAPAREITVARPAVAAAAPTPTVAPTDSPTEIYLQAFSDYAAGRFDQAIQGFETFLRLHAGSDYASNAQYWLAECYFSQQQYERAVTEFQRTVERYPQGIKTPDALLKMAAALTQLGHRDQAERALQLLRSRYPDSPAARRAADN